MATQDDVRRIALSLPGTEEAAGRFAFSVRIRDKPKGFVWVWMERVEPKKPRVPQPKVIAVRVASLDDKEFLLGLDPEKFFTEPHYDGFPAVLIRLAAVTARELKPIIAEAWRCQAPRSPHPRPTRRSAVLAKAKLTAFAATAQPHKAKAFYQKTLGLRLLTDDEFALAFDANGVQLRVQKVAKVNRASYTVLGWEVANIRRAMTTLAKSGVTFERYAFLDQDEAGVWTAPGGTRIAWFADPDGNLLSLAQHGAA